VLLREKRAIVPGISGMVEVPRETWAATNINDIKNALIDPVDAQKAARRIVTACHRFNG
jgi:hypothetical protein